MGDPLSTVDSEQITSKPQVNSCNQAASDLLRSKFRMFCDRNEKMMMENARTVRRSVDANEQARERAKTTPLRNKAQLNYVSLRSELDREVTCGAVKGQDERRPSAAPLTASQVTIERHANAGKQIKEADRGALLGMSRQPFRIHVQN